MTVAERHLWRGLRQSLPGHHWRKQVPFGPYVADFCSHSARLVIEVDGGQHADALEADARRTTFLQSEGYHVLRFWNDDAIDNLDGVLTTIATALPSLSEGARA